MRGSIGIAEIVDKIEKIDWDDLIVWWGERKQ